MRFPHSTLITLTLLTRLSHSTLIRVNLNGGSELAPQSGQYILDTAFPSTTSTTTNDPNTIPLPIYGSGGCQKIYDSPSDGSPDTALVSWFREAGGAEQVRGTGAEGRWD
ncbi:MAG: hypothetical protein Q9227_003184 [Pyrenula ochraceoflavens]